MFTTILEPNFAPFTLSLALLFALVALELVLLLVGLSLVADAGDLDLDVADVPDIGDLPELDTFADFPDIADYDIPDIAEGADVAETLDANPGALAWTGMGKAPFMIWLGAVFFGFGVTGLAVQFIFGKFGLLLPALIASIPAVIVAIWFAKTFSAGFAAILPKSETTAISQKRFGGYRGKITQGTSRRGHAAEVRITDRFGNNHYLRAEPVRDEDKIKQGTNVIILRNIRSGQMRLLPVS